MSKGARFCLLVSIIPAMGWAAENATATKPSDPTEIDFAELIKMEIPVVEAASKYKQKITEAPSSVTILTSEEVKRYGHRTLADVLAFWRQQPPQGRRDESRKE